MNDTGDVDLVRVVRVGHALRHALEDQAELLRQPFRAEKRSRAEGKRDFPGERFQQTAAVVEDTALLRDLGALWEHHGNLSVDRVSRAENRKMLQVIERALAALCTHLSNHVLRART